MVPEKVECLAVVEPKPPASKNDTMIPRLGESQSGDKYPLIFFLKGRFLEIKMDWMTTITFRNIEIQYPINITI